MVESKKPLYLCVVAQIERMLWSYSRGELLGGMVSHQSAVIESLCSCLCDAELAHGEADFILNEVDRMLREIPGAGLLRRQFVLLQETLRQIKP